MNKYELINEIAQVKINAANGKLNPVDAAVLIMELQQSLIFLLLEEKEAA